ncbi:hypothetical protein VRZ08_24560 [Rhodopseudomonas sp. G2_2311]|uniref:hypothetical protein n=1 Tax=Rhodopseudomonas sp. G2_2311 TaxID=3114287 RepID=UPI0039C69078
MRRDEIIAALRNVRHALEEAKIANTIFFFMRSGPKEGAAARAFQAYAHFMTSYSSFGPAERKIMDAMKVTPITSAEFWQRLVEKKEGPQDISATRFGAMLITDYFPSLESLFERNSDAQVFVSANQHGLDEKIVSARLRFFVREPDVPTLSLKHFVATLKAVESLYDALLRTYNLSSEESLIVGSLDSGSDKEFDVIGLAKGIKVVSETLLECWQRISNAKALKTSMNIKVACDSIDALQKLKAAQDNDSLSAEEAETLRRTILSSVETLFENGVYTEAMETQVAIIPSSLPVERKKLIVFREKSPTPDPGQQYDPEQEDDIIGPDD